MNLRSTAPRIHHAPWPDTMVAPYRSEAFAEDLEPTATAPAPRGWPLLSRLLAALSLLCVLAPVADAYLIH